MFGLRARKWKRRGSSRARMAVEIPIIFLILMRRLRIALQKGHSPMQRTYNFIILPYEQTFRINFCYREWNKILWTTRLRPLVFRFRSCEFWFGPVNFSDSQDRMSCEFELLFGMSDVLQCGSQCALQLQSEVPCELQYEVQHELQQEFQRELHTEWVSDWVTVWVTVCVTVWVTAKFTVWGTMSVSVSVIIWVTAWCAV